MKAYTLAIFFSVLILPTFSFARWVPGKCPTCPPVWVPDTPVQNYGAPVRSYGTPIQSYGTPVQSYGTPVQSYGTPVQSYGTPVQSYGTPVRSYPSYNPGQVQSYPSAQTVMPASGYNSCPTCVQAMPSASSSTSGFVGNPQMTASAPAAGSGSSRRKIVNGNERVVAIGSEGTKPPPAAAEYQWTNEGKIQFFDAQGKEIGHNGQPLASTNANGIVPAPAAAGSDAISPPRTVNGEGNSCREQAAKLPMKIDPKTGNLSLDPANSDVKKFLEANALPAVAKAMGEMFGEKASLKDRLDRLKADKELLASVKKLLSVYPVDEKTGSTPELRSGLESLFGFPKGLILQKEYPYGVDLAKLKELPKDTLQFLANFAEGGKVWTEYKEGIFHELDGWKNYCLPCTFHHPPIAAAVKALLGESGKALANK